ncbi:MAG: immune inhibitor A [Chloroflexi bacterium]|nr:immune inhibitor A [Chloroflexota bacterium]
MPNKALIIILALAFATTLRAQGLDYPMLEALAALEIPAFDYAQLIDDFYNFRTEHRPPSSPPVYEIGDRENLWVDAGAEAGNVQIDAELRGITDNVLIWVDYPLAYSNWRAQRMAEHIDSEIIEPIHELFQYAAPPGVDGDPRLTIVMAHNEESSWQGIFDKRFALPHDLNEQSNQREMVMVDPMYDDGSLLTEDDLASTIAHEYQHLLEYHRDNNEEWWMSEAMSTYVEYHLFGAEMLEWYGDGFMKAPNIGLTYFHVEGDRYAQYAAVGLFAIYLAQRFGEDIIARLYAESLDGWRGVAKVLRDHYSASADDVFADWVLANYFQDSRRGYGYDDDVENVLTPAQPTQTLRSFPAVHNSSLPQYSTEYIVANVSGADQLSLLLTQAPELGFIETTAPEGDSFYYAPASVWTDSSLIRDLGQMPSEVIWLEFKVWHETEEEYEVAYVALSTNAGRSWNTLKGEHTGEAYWLEDAYSGSSGGWRQERIDISDYLLTKVLLRFGLMTDGSTLDRGFAIDDLRIDAIDFYDDFESSDDAWVVEGWLRTDNRLPQNTWLQVVQETEDGLHLDRYLVTGTQQVDIDVQTGVSRAVIAVSPIVPQTALETEYSLAVSMIDAEGNVMTVSRDCTVTTTAGLNFRDAPNGNKIGLIIQGASVDALDRRGDWFQVDHDGTLGWVHAGYVTTKGNCP